MIKDSFIASDGWYIEGNTAWFIGLEYNAIFKADLRSLECEIICHLPVENVWKSRVNPICLKVEDYIVCLPSSNTSIYLYSIKERSIQEIQIDMPEKVPPDIFHYWYDTESGYIFAFSRGLQRVITIDVKNKRVSLGNIIGKNINIRYAIKVDQCLWLPNSLDNRIFSYNLKTEEVNEYLLSSVKGRLYAISYDGTYFWITGNRREIYIWNKEDNSVITINDFPQKFYEYTKHEKDKDLTNEVFKEVPFLYCVCCNKSIWCIPFQTNMILGIDKDTRVICGIESGETANDILSRAYNHKYLLEYIREDRYIGLFSMYENCIFELDTQNCRMERKGYYLTNKEMIDDNFPVFSESGINNFFYRVLLGEKENCKNKAWRSTGEQIYEGICNKHKY